MLMPAICRMNDAALVDVAADVALRADPAGAVLADDGGVLRCCLPTTICSVTENPGILLLLALPRALALPPAPAPIRDDGCTLLTQCV